jgi:hypothetical protein
MGQLFVNSAGQTRLRITRSDGGMCRYSRPRSPANYTTLPALPFSGVGVICSGHVVPSSEVIGILRQIVKRP